MESFILNEKLKPLIVQVYLKLKGLTGKPNTKGVLSLLASIGNLEETLDEIDNHGKNKSKMNSSLTFDDMSVDESNEEGSDNNSEIFKLGQTKKNLKSTSSRINKPCFIIIFNFI